MYKPIFVYHVPLPDGVHEIVLPCFDGHTVYLNQNMNYEESVAAYEHALRHIERGDFEKTDVQEIEQHAHEEE